MAIMGEIGMQAWRLFLKQMIVPEGQRGIRWRTLALEGMVALSLAFLLWIYTRSREQTSLDQIDVPIKITLAPGTAGNYELEINGSSRIPMSFIGPPSRMRELRTQIQRGLLQVPVQLAIPEENQNDTTYHNEVRIDPESVPVPPGISVVIAEGRNSVPYSLHRLVERLLPVRLDYAGELRISNIKLDPATVMVRGPKEVLDRAREISTQAYNVPPGADSPGNNHQVKGRASLVRELDGRPIQTTPQSVEFRFRVYPTQMVYEITEVPVRFLCPPGFAFRTRFATPDASKLTLKVIGPTSEETPNVIAYVDLTGSSKSAGRNVEAVRFQLPRDFRLVDDSPRLVSFYLDSIEMMDDSSSGNKTIR